MIGSGGDGILVRCWAPDAQKRARPELPGGLGWLSEGLMRAGVNHQVVDLNLDGARSRLFTLLKTAGWVGLSYFSPGYPRMDRLARELREARPDLPLIVGGPHATSLRGLLATPNTPADYAIMGEADLALPAFLKGETGMMGPLGPVLDLRSPDASRRARIARPGDLDALKFPTYRKFDLSQYSPIMPVSTSRGCSGRCSFCLAGLLGGRGPRLRSVDSVADEVRYWHARGYREFSIQDDDFTANQVRSAALAEQLLKIGSGHLSIYCGVGLRADSMDRSLMALLYAAGVRYVSVGVESGDHEVLARAHKDESPEVIAEGVRVALSLGIRACMNFVVGLPGDSLAASESSFRLARDLQPATSRFFHLIPFPGSGVHGWVRRNGRFNGPMERWMGEADVWTNQPSFETPEFSFAQRRRVFAEGNSIHPHAHEDQ